MKLEMETPRAENFVEFVLFMMASKNLKYVFFPIILTTLCYSKDLNFNFLIRPVGFFKADEMLLHDRESGFQ